MWCGKLRSKVLAEIKFSNCRKHFSMNCKKNAGLKRGVICLGVVCVKSWIWKQVSVLNEMSK